MLRRLSWLVGFVCLPLASLVACSEAVVIADGWDDAGTPSTGFTTPDSGNDAEASLPETVEMCPVSTCADPWTTCAASRFPCDTNLLTDDDNCGGCGIKCGGPSFNGSQWTCVDGQCVFGCTGMGNENCDKDPS
ncbi:MAG: hypothetical protein K0S65_6246, partial [Labilithrix sp.]|nr:hypothetical protein [Labilithrix sp.]